MASGTENLPILLMSYSPSLFVLGASCDRELTLLCSSPKVESTLSVEVVQAECSCIIMSQCPLTFVENYTAVHCTLSAISVVWKHNSGNDQALERASL